MTEIQLDSEPYVGEIRMFAGNSVPAGWANCDGRLLNIGDYPTLYGVIGTTYGGDGINRFALPDLRGRAPLGQGGGDGLTYRLLGQRFGVESISLSAAQLPAHAHTIQATNVNGISASPGGNVLAASSSNDPVYHTPGGAPVTMGGGTNPTGSGSPIPTFQPTIVLNFMIAVQGRDPRASARIIPAAPFVPS
jgi:microcystin-dependent protein